MTTDSLALDFKSATLYAVRVVLHSTDTERLAAALNKRMADAGSFFENEPVVIDASRVDDPVDWAALLQALRGHNLPPMGVVAEGDNLQTARAAGLTPVELSTLPTRSAPTSPDNTPPPLPTQPAAAVTSAPAPQIVPADAEKTTGANKARSTGETVDANKARGTDKTGNATNGGTGAGAENATATTHADKDENAANVGKNSNSTNGAPSVMDTNRDRPVGDPMPARAARETTSAPAPTPVNPQSSSALVISRPLRSGQRVYARHTDLIVIGMVSPGAEVIADGNIHIYGPLRGKAMAGARGDTSARIFTTHLDAELLAVAGVYRVVEHKLDATLHSQPALVRLDGDTLCIEALKM